MKISRFFFGGSKYSSYFCQRLKDDSKLSGRATFPWNSFLDLLPDDPFSRSFSVVFAVISGENRRISEKNGEYRGNLSVFIPFHSSSSNQPDFMLYNMFIVDTLSERLNV